MSKCIRMGITILNSVIWGVKVNGLFYGRNFDLQQ